MTSSPVDRSALVFLSRPTEQAERYEDMLVHTKQLVATVNEELTVEERNLLAVASKNVVGSRRAAWRVVSSIEDRTDDTDDVAKIQLYRQEIEKEVVDICTDVVTVVKERLLPHTGSEEGRVFLLKTMADYYRYLTEVQVGKERDSTAKKAIDAYTQAITLAMAEMPPTHPIRLGLALNFSVFYYETDHSPDRACNLAKQAIDDAIAELDTLTEESYKDSTLVMQLLRDNITLWTSDLDANLLQCVGMVPWL